MIGLQLDYRELENVDPGQRIFSGVQTPRVLGIDATFAGFQGFWLRAVNTRDP